MIPLTCPPYPSMVYVFPEPYEKIFTKINDENMIQ